MNAKLPRVSKRGYSLPGDGAQVLLFHGYTGSPYDLKPLALFLNQHGFSVRVPLLHGHGTKAEKLIGISATMWLDQAKGELAKLEPARPILVGGLSMGACLAILLARDTPAAAALLLFSPALSLKLSAELIISGAKMGLIPMDASVPKLSGGSDIADPVAKKLCPSYPQMPVSGLLEFDKLRKLACEEIAEIKSPIFSAFGQHDGAIDTRASHQQVLRSSGQVFSKFYGRSQHVLTLDYDRELLCSDVWRFITNNVGPQP